MCGLVKIQDEASVGQLKYKALGFWLFAFGNTNIILANS
jgi:hypothetical protein